MLKTCLVGGSGFIGSNMIPHLLKTGREVHIVDIQLLEYKDLNVHFHQINIQDAGALTALLSGMDEMIYLAHDGFPALHTVDPEHEVKANVFYTVQLFRQLHKTKLKKIVYFSSGGAVYGHTNKRKLKETDTTNPVSSYGIAKLAVEKYLRMFFEENDLPAMIVRPSNAYGPGQIPFKGQGFIATAVKLVQQNKPVAIYGEKGTVRDYLYIEDLVLAVTGLLEKGKAGETYNIGTGTGHSNLDMLRMIEPLANRHGLQLKLEQQPARPFDVNYNVLDSTKLKTTTGWNPKTPLEEGIEKTWEWLTGKFD